MAKDQFFFEGYTLPQSLEKKELYKLLSERKSGSTEAREKLITHNMRLVIYEVNTKFQKVEYDKKDLFSQGMIGLVKAIDTFDIEKGFEFATYAMRCIDNEILMFLRKLKKYQSMDSIEETIYYGNDGSELKLEDILSDGTDLVEEHERKENCRIIRELVKKLPDRDKEIILLHFGFYDNKIYTQKEIADRLHISQSYISRLVKRIVKRLKLQLENMEIVELQTGNYSEEEEMRKVQTIYEYFKNYTREQVDEMLSKLSEEEKTLITLRYGEDLDNPVSVKLTKQQTSQFYGTLIPKMKRLLDNPTGKKKRKTKEKKVSRQDIPTDDTSPLTEEKVVVLSQEMPDEIDDELEEDKLVPQQETLEQKVPVMETKEGNSNITKSDCIKMLELLRTPTFNQMISVLTEKEAVVILLKLGYIDGKYFSTSAISQFLGISEDEIIEITKKVLMLYKGEVVGFLDRVIKIATDSSTTDDKPLLMIKEGGLPQ